MRTPLISILLPVRNCGLFLDASLASLVAQNFDDFEILIVDNGSVDGSDQVIAKWQMRDRRIIPSKLARPGVAGALNLAAAQARGSLLARMDADDVALADRLMCQVAHLQQEPDIGLLGTWADRIDREDNRLGRIEVPTEDAQIRHQLARSNPFLHPTVMMRTDIFRRAGGYRRGCRISEDYDLWLRMADLTGLANIDRPLLAYRIHEASATIRSPVRQAICDACVQASAVARQSGRPEPFVCGSPSLRRALPVLGLSRQAFKYRVVKALASQARGLRAMGRQGQARDSRRRLWKLVRELPPRLALRSLGRVLASYSRP